MAVKHLTIFQQAPNYPSLPPTALSLDMGAGEVATAAADGVDFPCTGHETIIVLGGAAGHALTVKSVVDQWNRSGDIVYTVGIGLYSVLPKIQPAGFLSSGVVQITLDAGGTDVKFWCIRDAN